MTASTDTRSLPELLSTLINEMSTLFRQEIRLARTETTENIGKMAGALGMLAAAAVIVLPGLVVLLLAIAAMLAAQGMELQWALLVVSLVAIAIGGILLMVGLGRLKASSLTPDRTIEQVRRDATVAKEQVR
jgi:membrane protein DedA with SNARE-associated domain